MRNILKIGFLAFAFGLIFVSAESVNAQNRREARREYREEIRDARKDYRRDIRKGKSVREARRDFREERRDARREYRKETGRNYNRGYYSNRGRRGYTQGYRVYYRNGRRYVVRNY